MVNNWFLEGESKWVVWLGGDVITNVEDVFSFKITFHIADEEWREKFKELD